VRTIEVYSPHSPGHPRKEPLEMVGDKDLLVWRLGNEAKSVARLASWTPPGMFTLLGGDASSGVRANVEGAYCSEEEVRKKR